VAAEARDPHSLLFDESLAFPANHGSRSRSQVATGFVRAEAWQLVHDSLPDGQATAAGDAFRHFRDLIELKPLCQDRRKAQNHVEILSPPAIESRMLAS
jgi:hypothetical protein